MPAKHIDRIWLAAGALVCAALIVLTWFLLVSPQREQRDGLHAQTAVAEVKVAALQRRLTELRKQQVNLEEYKAKLAEQRLALPTESGMAALLLELRDAGANSGVSVDNLLVAPAVEVPGGNAGLYQLPVTLISNGTAPNLEKFLSQLQRIQPRAILINTANVTVDEADKALTSKVTMTLNLFVFVAPENVPAATATGGAVPTPSATE